MKKSSEDIFGREIIMRIEGNERTVTFGFWNNESEKSGHGNVFSAGSQTSNGNDKENDTVTGIRVKAQRKALKVIAGQFTNDKKIDDRIESGNNRVKEIENEITDISTELARSKESRAKLKEDYGITEDSTEEKNMPLLEKQRQSLKKDSKVKLTEDEKAAIEKMGPQTEYQQAALSLNGIDEEYNRRLKEANDLRQYEADTVKGIKKALLKVHPMVDASSQAEDIIKEANDKVIDTLIVEAKDSVDEKFDKIKEDAQKTAEEKAEEEKAAAEKAAEKAAAEKMAAEKAAHENGASGNMVKNVMENESNDKKISGNSADVSAVVPTDIASINAIQQSAVEQKQFQSEIRTLVANQKLCEDDTKGILVDDSI